MSAELTPELTDLILSANAGNGAFVVTTDTEPALFIGTDKRVGISTITPESDLEINSKTGSCVKLVYNKSATNYTKMDMDDAGNLSIIPNTEGSAVGVSSIVDAEGLYLGGTQVVATPSEMNGLAGSVPGTIKPGKVLVVNDDSTISGVSAVSATELSGTVQNSYQPNITKVGVLESLSIRGAFKATQFGGEVLTADQPRITQVGTLESLDISGSTKASRLTGTLTTGAQPNIKSIGALSTLTLAGTTITDELIQLSGSIPGSAIENKVVILGAGTNIIGVRSLVATDLSGSIQTARQPNITSLGTLGSLNIQSQLVASSLSGTVQTAGQPLITSLGELSSITLQGTTISSQFEYITGVSKGEADLSKAILLDANKGIKTINNLSATTIAGRVQTAEQLNITSIGSLNNVSILGYKISTQAAYASGAIPGEGAPLKMLVANSSNAVGTISSISANSIYGTIQTGSQPNITNPGPLSSLDVSGVVSLTSLSETSTSATGALRVRGGVGIAQNVYVGGKVDASAISINGVLVGTLIPAAPVNTTPTPMPSYIQNVTPGIADNGKVLTLNADKSVTGISNIQTGSLNATDASSFGSLTVNGFPIDASVNGPASIANLTLGTAEANKMATTGDDNEIAKLGSVDAESGTFESITTTGLASVQTLQINGAPFTVNSSTKKSPFLSKDQVVSKLMDTWVPFGPKVSLDILSIAYSPTLNIYALAVKWRSSSSMWYTTTNFASVLLGTSSNSGFQPTSVIWHPTAGSFIAVGSNNVNTNNAMVSSNGTSWTVLASAPINVIYNSIACSDSYRYMAVGNGYYAASQNLGTFTGFVLPGTLNSVCWSTPLQIFIAVGPGKVLYYNPAIGFTHLTPNSITWNAVCWSDSMKMFVAVGNNAIMTSSDGIEWTLRTSPGDYNWKSIIFCPRINTFVASTDVSGAKTLMTSSDGKNWSLIVNDPGYGVTSMYWDDTESKFSMYVLSTSSATQNMYQTKAESTLAIYSATESTSRDTGALVVAGGMAVGKQIAIKSPYDNAIRLTSASSTYGSFLYNSVYRWGILSSNSTVPGGLYFTESTTARLLFQRGGNIATNSTVVNANKLYISGTARATTFEPSTLTVASVTASSSTITGALIISGGVGIAENTNVSSIFARSTLDDVSTGSYAVDVAGGVGIGGLIYSSGVINCFDTTPSTSTDTGALVCSGGMGIAGTLSTNGLRIGSTDLADSLTAVSAGQAQPKNILTTDATLSVSQLGTVSTRALGSELGQYIPYTLPSATLNFVNLLYTDTTHNSAFAWTRVNPGYLYWIKNNVWNNLWASASRSVDTVGYWKSKNIVVSFTRMPSMGTYCTLINPTTENKNYDGAISSLQIVTLRTAFSPTMAVMIGNIGATGYIYTSSDGITWTLSITTTVALNALEYSPTLDIFVASAGSNIYYNSPGQTTFSTTTMAQTFLYGIIWFDKLNQFIGSTGNQSNLLYWSSNGTTWSKIESNSTQLGQILHVKELGMLLKYVVGGVTISYDSVNWRNIMFPVSKLYMYYNVSDAAFHWLTPNNATAYKWTPPALINITADTTTVTSTATSALTVSGGVGVAGDVNALDKKVNNVDVEALKAYVDQLQATKDTLETRVAALEAGQ